MSDKLELKHLAPYLPYGLKVMTNNETIMVASNYRIGGGMGIETVVNGQYKPILRPLSDLTNEIEINGEWFIPLGKLHYRYCLTASRKRTTKAMYENIMSRDFIGTAYKSETFGIKIYPLEIGRTEHRIMTWLFKWGFDVFGLIDEGLAIDINDLKE